VTDVVMSLAGACLGSAFGYCLGMWIGARMTRKTEVRDGEQEARG
jgi:hypothetical protein